MRDKFGRYDWDSWFIAQCFMLSLRSIDPDTKHGSIIVGEHHQVLSQGYTGPIAGIDDDLVPLTRPEKYFHLQHAEEAALIKLNAPRDIIQKGTMYITGRPCHKCMRMALNKGIRSFIYGPVRSKIIDSEDIKATNLMLELVRKNEPVSFVEYCSFHSVDEIHEVIDGLRASLIKTLT